MLKTAANQPGDFGKTRLRSGRSPTPRYFQELTHIPSLGPNQEFDLAQDLEQRELALWDRLLSYGPVLRLLLPTIRHHLAEAQDTDAIEAVDRLARTRGDAKALRERLSLLLRTQDPDRQLLDDLLATVRQALRPPRASASKTKPSRTAQGKSRGLDPSSSTVKAFARDLSTLNSAALETRNTFVRANLRLVITIAHRYDTGRLPFQDLIQEGNIGLIKAVGRFDHRKGCRFSTYASWWIRHSLSRAVADKARMVRVPVYLQARHHRINRTQIELSNKLGRMPTNDEISLSSDLSASAINGLRGMAPGESVSLDRPVADDDGQSFLDMLPDPDGAAPGDQLDSEQSLQQMREILAELPPMEADILRRRFGLEDGREHTLKEIGRQYNLCRERIRQIQQKVLAKMRTQMD